MHQVQLEVRPEPQEVGRARRWVRSRLAGHGIAADEPVAETLILLVSELVTNVVVHAGCPAVLRMWLPAPVPAGAPVPGAGPEVVRVEVADGSSRPPRRRCSSGCDTSGRGLELVALLADRWGWEAEGAGKSIWCEVERELPVAATTVGEPQCAATNPA